VSAIAIDRSSCRHDGIAPADAGLAGLRSGPDERRYIDAVGVRA
jgi:hypothetical protein